MWKRVCDFLGNYQRRVFSGRVCDDRKITYSVYRFASLIYDSAFLLLRPFRPQLLRLCFFSFCSPSGPPPPTPIKTRQLSSLLVASTPAAYAAPAPLPRRELFRPDMLSAAAPSPLILYLSPVSLSLVSPLALRCRPLPPPLRAHEIPSAPPPPLASRPAPPPSSSSASASLVLRCLS